MKAKNGFLWALLAVVSLLGGCAGSMKMLPDGTYVGMVTVGDTLDRSASVIGRYKAVGKNPDGSPIFEEVQKSDLAVGPTVAGQVVVGVTTGVATAGTQGLFGIQIAKENAKACANGKCGGSTTFNVQGGSGVAGAFSSSESGANVGVGISGCSRSGGCN